MIEENAAGVTLRIEASQGADLLELSAERRRGGTAPAAGVPYRVSARNRTKHPWRGIITCTASLTAGSRPFFLLPAFLYGTNRADQPVHPKAKKWPRIRPGTPEPPFAPAFTVRADRLSHPAAFVRAGDAAAALSGSPVIRGETAGPETAAGFGCFWRAGQAGVVYTAGYRNEPWLYKGSRLEIDDPGCGLLEIPPESDVSFDIVFYSMNAGNRENLDIFSPVLKNVYRQYHQTPRNGAAIREGAEELALPLFRDAFNREARNYCTTLTLKDGQAVQDTGSFSISWTGGMQSACPLLMAGLRLGNEAMREQSASCIDNITANSINRKSGLPFDAWRDGRWTADGWWSEYVWSLEGKRGHSSYLIGQALYYICKSYDWERKLGGAVRENWLSFVQTVTDRIEETKNSRGEYPYRWSAETGDAAEYDSFCGAWCLAARAYLLVLTGNTDLLPGCRRSLYHYWKRYVKKMLCYGAPHDTWKAPDQEGILAFAKAARLLHEVSGDPEYLDALRDGLDYEFSWKYCRNTDPGIPPLSEINWSSSGGSVTSVANQCVHPMGNIITDEIHYYWKQTGDSYYLSRLKDTLLWGLQTYNRYDGEYGHGKKGWLSERFDASRVTVQFTYPDGRPSSTWFVYHPWAAGCVLESLTGEVWGETAGEIGGME